MFSLAAPPTLPRPYEAASFAEHFSQIPFCHAITVKPVFYCIWNRSHMVVLSMFSMNKQYKRKLDVCILYSSFYYTTVPDLDSHLLSFQPMNTKIGILHPSEHSNARIVRLPSSRGDRFACCLGWRTFAVSSHASEIIDELDAWCWILAKRLQCKRM